MVANSTASSDRHGPRRWMTSALKRPLIVSASGDCAPARWRRCQSLLDCGTASVLPRAPGMLCTGPVFLFGTAESPLLGLRQKPGAGRAAGRIVLAKELQEFRSVER